jgi:anhydro-N-acetylmuramic acid kinase
MTTRWIIGLASGSSGDGVDAALLEVQGVGMDVRPALVQSLHLPYGADLRELIASVASSEGNGQTRQVALIHRLLGETFAAAARQVADRASFSLQKLQCIGCPGHTVWHDPEGRFPSTLPLGMAAVVAERTGVTTVSDFRSRDVAAGGQGVPLAALVDWLLFRHPTECRLLLHLGGLARVVHLPAGGRLSETAGFEAAPCNVLLDALIRRVTGGREPFDAGGKHAVQGRCVEPLLRRWLAHPALQRRPPRSLPRHAFGTAFATQVLNDAHEMGVSLHDLLCTGTHFVAQSVIASLRRFLPRERPIDRVLLSGGGTRNGLLWVLLTQALEAVPMERTDTAGIPGDARKALSFGILAALTVDVVPASVPSATGAVASRLLGSLTPGGSANWARCLSWMASQTAHLVRSDDREW